MKKARPFGRALVRKKRATSTAYFRAAVLRVAFFFVAFFFVAFFLVAFFLAAMVVLTLPRFAVTRSRKQHASGLHAWLSLILTRCVSRGICVVDNFFRPLVARPCGFCSAVDTPRSVR